MTSVLSLPWRVFIWGLSNVFEVVRVFVEVVSLVDAYLLNLATSIINHYRKKIFGVLMEFSLIPFNLAYSALEMICFGLFVAAPAYLQARRQYRKDASRISKNVRYGERPGQFLDVYLLDTTPQSWPLSSPTKVTDSAPPLAPVVVFIQGGGWTICQKALYVNVGATLRSRGIITVIPEYTPFPQVRSLRPSFLFSFFKKKILTTST